MIIFKLESRDKSDLLPRENYNLAPRESFGTHPLLGEFTWKNYDFLHVTWKEIRD